MDGTFAGSRYADELAFMYRIIRDAGKILLRGKVEGHEVRFKADNSIVTSIDHECAAYLDGEIQARYPTDAILNEETHHLAPDTVPWKTAERCWILDPLDSTSSYVRNGQHYGVILALSVAGRPVAGMTYKPELGELYYAAKGEGAFRAFVGSDDGPVQTFPVKVSNDPRVNLILSYGRQTPGLQDMIRRLGNPPFHRMNGSLKINEVARGEYTAFVSPQSNPMSLWDLAATQVVLEEAGGRITDLQGHPIDFRGPPLLTQGIVASNAVTHQFIVARLS
jgi:3'(2'), 5'-bisphosphate nucleotidase